MQRRKFLIGMGSLAAGGAATIGTGAFSSSNDSDSTIDVVGDEYGLIGLAPTSDRGVVQFGGPNDKQLVIDFSGTGSHGVPKNSYYQVGKLAKPSKGAYPQAVNDNHLNSLVDDASDDQSAFSITNNTSEQQELYVEYTTDDAAGTARIFFEFERPDGSTAHIDVAPSDNSNFSQGSTDRVGVALDGAGAPDPSTVFSSGDSVEVSMFIDADAKNPGEVRLGGTLTVESSQASI